MTQLISVFTPIYTFYAEITFLYIEKGQAFYYVRIIVIRLVALQDIFSFITSEPRIFQINRVSRLIYIF